MYWGTTGASGAIGTPAYDHHGVVFQAGAGTQFTDLTSPAIPDDTWTHMLMTYNSGGVTFYYDGVVGGSGTVSSTLLTGAEAAVLFGKHNLGAGNDSDPLYGDLAIYRIWDDVLTPGEISASYAADLVRFVPEPSLALLVLLGFAGVILRRRRAS